MAHKDKSPASEPVKLADADLLGDAVIQPDQPIDGPVGTPDTSAPSTLTNTPTPPEPTLDATDENQPGFIGRRNQPEP